MHVMTPGARGVTLLVAALAAALAVGGSAAQATRFPPSGVRFLPDVGARPGTKVLLFVETNRGTLRNLSFRAARDVVAEVPRSTHSYTVGRLITHGGRRPLVMPAGSTGRRPVTLLHRGSLRVVLRSSNSRHDGDKAFLSVDGLPRASTLVEIEFDGLGRGIIGPPHDCPNHPTLVARVERRGAPAVNVANSSSCRPSK